MAIFMNGIESYKGCVLAEYENNGYHDSDFFAVVWDAKEQCIKTVMFGTTRGGGSWGCHIDATPEVLALAQAVKQKAQDDYMAKQALQIAKLADKGKTVIIHGFKRGKKTSLNGLQGEIFWVGANKFAPHYEKYSRNVGIKIGDEKVFVTNDKVTVVGFEESCYDALRNHEISRKVQGYIPAYRF
jgi:hypothetical protein